MRIDSHQHFWEYDPEQYGWMNDQMTVLKHDHLPSDLSIVQADLAFDGSIAIQARQTLEETRWLLNLADKDERIKGVVGWVDLRNERIDNELAEFREHPKFVGVRHVVQDEPDECFILQPDFLRGIGKLREYGLTYDILIYPIQLPATLEFVPQFQDQPFVLDHIAKPYIKDGTIEPWAAQIAKLAKFHNVHCKISGMVTEGDWRGWKPRDFDPYLQVILDAFGPERLMIGSDWPVCQLAGEYTQVMQLAIDFMQTHVPEHVDDFLGGNALAFYGITA
jgi:L-fuconolactonase|tara:strand:+ start:3084 stop:3917 length:834 start_codon:yes stop_codon:yes gene_type:complete